MKNVDIIKHPKMTNPAVQIFLNMNGTVVEQTDDDQLSLFVTAYEVVSRKCCVDTYWWAISEVFLL